MRTDEIFHLMGIRSFTHSGHQLTEAEIEAFERGLGATLPTPYRRFLLRHNGGRPHPGECLHERTVRSFLKIGDDPDDFHDIRAAIENLRDDLPDGVIPIAWLESADAIVLALTGENRGRVYRWNSDGQAPAYDLRKHAPWLELGDDYVFIPDDWPGHADLKLYAENFDEFLESFHEPDSDE